MKDKHDPEDIFEWDELAAWAKENGFVHSEQHETIAKAVGEEDDEYIHGAMPYQQKSEC